VDPFRDRHFVHYQLQDYYNLQDYNRYNFGSGYQTVPWSGDYPRQTPRRDAIIAPAGETPRVLPTPTYDYPARPDLGYYRSLMSGSPSAYPAPPPLKPRAWQTSPSEMISPFDSKTGQPGSDAYAP
jgi:hypothetical protein